jgi:hypothetical protein
MQRVIDNGFSIAASREPRLKGMGCARLKTEGENPVGHPAEIATLRKEVEGLRADIDRLTRLVALSRADYKRLCDLFRQSYERELDRVDRAVADLLRAATEPSAPACQSPDPATRRPC